MNYWYKGEMPFYKTMPEGKRTSIQCWCNCCNCKAVESVKVTEIKYAETKELEVIVELCTQCGVQHIPRVYGKGNETMNGIPVVIGIEIEEPFKTLSEGGLVYGLPNADQTQEDFDKSFRKHMDKLDKEIEDYQKNKK